GHLVEGIPQSARELLDLLERAGERLSVEEYRARFAGLPDATRAAMVEAWGELGAGKNMASAGLAPSRTTSAKSQRKPFPCRAARFGNIVVALAPDRGRSEDRRADYHDPKLPPRHELVAFGLWLREKLGCHALVHVGAHGTLEWLPGKTVALSGNC